GPVAASEKEHPLHVRHFTPSTILTIQRAVPDCAGEAAGQRADRSVQRPGADDITMLAYLRALRRIDVCGLLTRDALPKVGEIVSVGTLFAFDECDAEVKVSGDSDRRFVSVEVG